jgi:hypothetical protein
MSAAGCRVRALFRHSPTGVDKFRIHCDHIALGPGSNGIDPNAEGATLSLADPGGPCFSETIAADDFIRRGLSGGWAYNGPKGGPGLRTVRLKPNRITGEFRLRVTSKSADLQCLSGAPVLGLTIGDDVASQPCSEIRGGVYECP